MIALCFLKKIFIAETLVNKALQRFVFFITIKNQTKNLLIIYSKRCCNLSGKNAKKNYPVRAETDSLPLIITKKSGL